MIRSLITASLLILFTAPATKAADTEKPAAKEAAAEGAVSKLIATTYGTSNLHRVSSDGKIVPFKLPAGTEWGNGSINGGSNDPLESPDRKVLAFVQKGSLLIRPMEGGKAATVVSGYAHHELLISGWSLDGQSLVYFLGPPQAEDAPPSKVKGEKHFVYDLKSKASREIKLGGALRGWLPGGEMVIHNSENGTVSSLALTQGAVPKILLKDAKEYGQMMVSPDGKKLAVSLDKFGSPGSSQLITVDLAGGEVTPLTKPGGWADFQWPQWSPSGKRMAWETRTGMKEGRPLSVVVVDGKNLTQPAELTEYHWLTEKVLAVVELEAIAVVDADSGKELGRKAIGKKTK